MNRRFFLDTNIFVYSLDRTAPAKAVRACELIRQAIEKRQGIVSYQVVQEFFNVAFRRFAQSMSLADAEQYLAMTFRPLLAVHSSQALLADAMRSKDKFQVPWYDALIVVSALEGKCTALYSEDFQHGQKFGELRIINPFL